MAGQLQQEMLQFYAWRSALSQTIGAYRAWLADSALADRTQLSRLDSLAEGLRSEKLVLAFVAEFSRGKTELINALFFSDFKRRLLPSDVGRTTMCPTEVFFDATHPPSLRLLPIDTRSSDQSLAQWKKVDKAWRTFLLDPAHPEAIVRITSVITQTKLVSAEEAKKLGFLADDPGIAPTPDAQVRVPAWRYAMLNFPHPLLKSGLVILDTPGLNALGAEPELTVSSIPGAHAVLFLLAADTGVTRSDMTIWRHFVEPQVEHRLAVLNKIDVLWDELKSPAEIDMTIAKQLSETRDLLKLPPSRVFAVSAQKGLLARIRGDRALLLRSGLPRLEAMLAKEIIPSRYRIARNQTVREIGAMIRTSLQLVRGERKRVEAELAGLGGITERNHSVMLQLDERVILEEERFDASVRNYDRTHVLLDKEGHKLLALLDEERLHAILQAGRDIIESSWTTHGLMLTMENLSRLMLSQFEQTLDIALRITKWLDSACYSFHEKHGFEHIIPQPLTLESHRHELRLLVKRTEAFCDDLVNIMTEKHFLVRKFFLAIMAEVEKIFAAARSETESWLQQAEQPLQLEIQTYHGHLSRRREEIMAMGHDLARLDKQQAHLQQLAVELRQREAALGRIVQMLAKQVGAESQPASAKA